MAINVLKQSKTEIEKAAEDAKVRKVVEATLGEIEKNGDFFLFLLPQVYLVFLIGK